MSETLVVLSPNEPLSVSRDGYSVIKLTPKRFNSDFVTLSIKKSPSDQHPSVVIGITVSDDGTVGISASKHEDMKLISRQDFVI